MVKYNFQEECKIILEYQRVTSIITPCEPVGVCTKPLLEMLALCLPSSCGSRSALSRSCRRYPWPSTLHARAFILSSSPSTHLFILPTGRMRWYSPPKTENARALAIYYILRSLSAAPHATGCKQWGV